MIIGSITELAVDDGKIVLGLICIGIFSLAPLGDVLVIAHTHDRRPGNKSIAMPLVVANTGRAIMAQSEIVPEFMDRRFGNGRSRTSTQVIEIHQCRRIIGRIIRSTEHIDVRYPTGTGVGHIITRRRCASGNQYVAGGAGEGCWLFSSNIDIERCQIFCNPMPDLSYSRAFGSTESHRVTVQIKRNSLK